MAPWRVETFKVSTDPELVAKVTDVVGLYLAPPENAIVPCIDEKSQIQALDRTAPMLPMQPGLPARRTHDYRRHGTTTLFAALEIATGTVTGAVKPRHRHQEFLAFLKQVARAYSEGELHLVMDNYAAHKRVEVRDWLAANPRIHAHFTPTSGSWLNLVRAHPFVWTKTAEQILKKANRQNTSNTSHWGAHWCRYRSPWLVRDDAGQARSSLVHPGGSHADRAIYGITHRDDDLADVSRSAWTGSQLSSSPMPCRQRSWRQAAACRRTGRIAYTARTVHRLRCGTYATGDESIGT